VEEDRIKTAFEIAMERISGLPELTPEEIAAQKEKQYRPIGEAIAGRYLKSLISSDEITAEMNKYRDEQKQIVEHSLISSLCRALLMEGDPESAARALEGVSRLKPEKKTQIEKATEDFQSIRHEFDREKHEKSNEFGAVAVKRMRELGISGSAVRSNPNENPDWQQELANVRQKHESRLMALRISLQQELQDA
jgi:hypothetical protein